MHRPLFAAACLLLASFAAAQEVPHAFVDAEIIPIDGPPIARGAIVVHEGRIVSIAPVGEVVVPDGAVVRDLAGHVIMPGLICTHSHVGGIGGADGSGTVQPEIRIHESIDVHDAGFRRAVAGGLTALNIMPGSGHLISGQTVYVKLRRAERIDDLLIHDDDGRVMGGLKMANGTNPLRVDGRVAFTGTRARSAAVVRQHFIRAQEHRDRIAAAGDDVAKLPPRDLGLEALIEVMEGRRIVHHHTHRHDDIVTVLRLAKEFGFRVVLHHVSEGWRVADEIAAAEVPCSIIVVDSPGGKLEALHLIFETGGVLEQAGVRVAFHTDDYITDSRLFFRMAALAVRAGMSREAALAALTIEGARMMDLQDRIGSLAVGKDADLVILDGDPLSVYTKVLETWIEGERVFDRSDPDDRLHAVGGFGAGHDVRPYLCCQDVTTAGGAQ